jgi:hypothetical protein
MTAGGDGVADDDASEVADIVCGGASAAIAIASAGRRRGSRPSRSRPTSRPSDGRPDVEDDRLEPRPAEAIDDGVEVRVHRARPDRGLDDLAGMLVDDQQARDASATIASSCRRTWRRRARSSAARRSWGVGAGGMNRWRILRMERRIGPGRAGPGAAVGGRAVAAADAAGRSAVDAGSVAGAGSAAGAGSGCGSTSSIRSQSRIRRRTSRSAASASSPTTSRAGR